MSNTITNTAVNYRAFKAIATPAMAKKVDAFVRSMHGRGLGIECEEDSKGGFTISCFVISTLGANHFASFSFNFQPAYEWKKGSRASLWFFGRVTLGGKSKTANIQECYRHLELICASENFDTVPPSRVI